MFNSVCYFRLAQLLKKITKFQFDEIKIDTIRSNVFSFNILNISNKLIQQKLVIDMEFFIQIQTFH